MNEREKSDSPVVPAKPPNKSGAAVTEAEAVEERGLAKGNTDMTQHVPDAVPESTCQVGWIVCVK